MDVRPELSFRTAPGLTAWQVALGGELFASAAAAGGRLPPGLFPPQRGQEELRKCLRVMPHHNDTGGAGSRWKDQGTHGGLDWNETSFRVKGCFSSSLSSCLYS